ncbi:MAG TPA: nuclear transport factor 2 family protein [Candidatus Eisenbacteria bacterium]|nr:nuclear transport factor 2 family protein [Candidatus Eisenbacteria bacterium]
MPWLSEFGALIGAHPPVGGDAESVTGAIVEVFPDGVRVDDPGAGAVEGQPAIVKFIAESAVWLNERRARVTPIAMTVGVGRTVAEFDVELTVDESTFVLPVAVAIEPGADSRSVWIRIYHSHWPLLGHHVVRPPLLPGDPAIRESDIVGEYQSALAAGDADRITATFEPDGCFREPAGPQHRVCGTATLREFFGRFFSLGGGIILEHCTVTEDGVRTALEFNAIRWGPVDMPHQAGIAVYERGATSRIANTRVYDDVDPPLH